MTQARLTYGSISAIDAIGMAGSMAMPARAPRLRMRSRVRRGWRVVSGWIEMMLPETAANEATCRSGFSTMR